MLTLIKLLESLLFEFGFAFASFAAQITKTTFDNVKINFIRLKNLIFLF